MRARLTAVVVLVLVAACKSPTPADEMESILSWVGTAAVTGEAWLRHTTPDKYSRQTLDLADQTILQISSELLKAPPASVDSGALDSVITRTRQHISQMSRLIEAKNSPEFARALDSLRTDQKMVKQLSDSIEAKQ
jgi:hypothetical protein